MWGGSGAGEVGAASFPGSAAPPLPSPDAGVREHVLREGRGMGTEHDARWSSVTDQCCYGVPACMAAWVWECGGVGVEREAPEVQGVRA